MNERPPVRLIELIAVGTLLIFILWIYAPSLVGKYRAFAMNSVCVNQLKTVGIGFTSYANENNDRFPMELPLRDGGTLEYKYYPGQAWRHFQAVGEHLANPKVLACPAEPRAINIPNHFQTFTNDVFTTYFISLRAEARQEEAMLAGDADLFFRGQRIPKALEFPVSTNYFWGKRHNGKGNVLFCDGTVRGMGRSSFVEAVRAEGAIAQAMRN